LFFNITQDEKKENTGVISSKVENNLVDSVDNVDKSNGRWSQSAKNRDFGKKYMCG